MSDTNNAPQQQRSYNGSTVDVQLYDEVHSAISVASVGGLYSNSIMLDVRARDSGSTDGRPKYLSENTFKMTFNGAEAYTTMLKLRAFIDGELNDFTISRAFGNTEKTLTFCRASDLYDETNPEMQERCANGLAIYAEENGSAVAFVCYGEAIELSSEEGAEPVFILPEMELLYSAFYQACNNFLRLDAAVVRTMVRGEGAGNNNGRTNQATTQPSLRPGGNRRPSIGNRGGAPAGRSVSSRPGATNQAQPSGDEEVTEDDMSQFVNDQ